MEISKAILEEVKSSDGHLCDFFIPKTREGKDRKNEVIDVLKKLGCENIIHVGACGHLKGIQKQLDANKWFHDKLCLHFKNVIGTDINKEAVAYLIGQGKKNLYDIDITADGLSVKQLFKANEGGCILLPEVLEHIEEPYDFLRKVRKNFNGYHIVITVPNAFGTWVLTNILNHNYEKINTDHKYWFTPFTLLKVAALAGIEVKELRFCDYSIMTKILKKPILANTLLLVGKL